jgi:RimJ/RimL family protein N-acetyltransferase
MNIYSIKDLSDRKIINFLEKNLSLINDRNTIQNYHPDFKNVSGNIFYILKEGRYKTGNYFIMEEEGKYLGSSGWNRHENVALLLTRSYIPPRYRRQYLMANQLLPLMFKETVEFERLWITCNDYNISIYRAFEKLHDGRRAGLFDAWPKIYNEFKPIGKKVVNYTEQYVVEHRRSRD